MLEDIADEFVPEVLADVNWEVLDPWINPHTLVDLWEEEGWEEALVELDALDSKWGRTWMAYVQSARRWY